MIAQVDLKREREIDRNRTYMNSTYTKVCGRTVVVIASSTVVPTVYNSSS